MLGIIKSYSGYCFYTIAFIVFSITCSAQNLITNGGFEEDIYGPPITRCNEDSLPGSQICRGWFSASKGTPDFFNSDQSRFRAFALMKAHSGEGRLGLYLAQKKFPNNSSNYREYIESKLSAPLKAGNEYCLTFYAAFEKRNKFIAKSIGVYFSNDSLIGKSDNVIPVIPQVNFSDTIGIVSKNEWMKFTAVYTAKGGEKFITLGNFDPGYALKVRKIFHKRNFKATWCSEFHHYAYYYIDDVSLLPINPKKSVTSQVSEDTTHYILLLDVSESMKENNKLDSLKKAASEFIRQLPPKALVSIVTFSEKSSIYVQAKPAADIKSLVTIIDSLHTTGSTDFNEGIRTAYYIANASGEFAKIIVVTDGIFAIHGGEKKLILKSFTDNKTQLSAIQIGGTQNKQLDELCRETNGRYDIAAHKNYLSSVFKSDYLFRESGTPVAYYHGSIPLIALTPLKFTGIFLAALAVYEVIKSGAR